MADDSQNAPQDAALDQGEIENLVSSPAAAPAQGKIYHAGARRRDGAPAPKVEPYDFRNPVFLTEVELRRLRILHEDFIRYLSARLSLFLRMEFALKISKLGTQNYAKFTDELSSPAHLCLFKAEPLSGVGIVDVSPRLALSLVDRMLGGRGYSVKLERHLTEIEIALLEDILRIVLEEWAGQWRHEGGLKPQIIGHENNGRFLQTSPRDAIMLVLALEVGFGDCKEALQIAIPYYTVEPMVKTMQARRVQESASTAGRKPATAEWKAVYEHITLPARAEWDAFELSLRELTHLRVGDVLEMPNAIVDQTRVSLAGSPKFTGTVGLDGERVVVKLSQKLNSEDSSHARTY